MSNNYLTVINYHRIFKEILEILSHGKHTHYMMFHFKKNSGGLPVYPEFSLPSCKDFFQRSLILVCYGRPEFLSTGHIESLLVGSSRVVV